VETRPPWFYRQSGVIPFRQKGERLEVLLITNRRRTRWIIPKGIVEPGLSAAESAVREAWEEAGIRGTIGTLPAGEYSYAKWGGTCTVQVFPFRVGEVSERWPEEATRDRQWVSFEEAVERVREAELQKLLARLPEMLAGGGDGQAWLTADTISEEEG